MFERYTKEFKILEKILGKFVWFMKLMTSWYVSAPLWFCLLFFVGGQPLWYSIAFGIISGYIGHRMWADVKKDRMEE